MAPGAGAGVFRGRLVIVYGTGPGSGLFVYSGQPAAGNPPIFWAASASTDPYGNALPSTTGVAGGGAFRAGNTIINIHGVFTYSGTPAAGNLITSDAQQAGVDDFGNTYKQGFTNYLPSGNAIQIVNGNLTIFDTNGTTAIGNLGPSSAPGVTYLSQVAGVLVTDPLSAAKPGSAPVTAETWTTLGIPGIAGWSSDRGRYRMTPDGEVEIDIILHATAVTAGGSQNAYPNALAAAYRPAFHRAYPMGITSLITGNNRWPSLDIDTAGVVTLNLPPNGVGAGIQVGGNVRMPLD
jgi:hypothetical protein